MWNPKYTLTTPIVRALMEIEGAKAVVEQIALPPAAERELRRRARLRSTHYSTQIEGNRLTLAETEQAIASSKISFHGRERDAREVRCYWNAFLRVEAWAAQQTPLTEELIRKLHALVERGTLTKPTPYRDGQNVIRDGATGGIVYMPPIADDVPELMRSLIAWTQQAAAGSLPVPLIAGLLHYQFATIHPYFDGNGRTARLLATFLLHRDGYGMNGFFSLEEYHARDLDAYYRALALHPHHNYYEGRAEADLTPWLEYFTGTLARVFTIARGETLRYAREGLPAEPAEIRRLDARARRVLALFASTERITAAEIAAELGLSERMARSLLQNWTAEGWLTIENPSRKGRAYGLSAVYRQFIGDLSAMHRND